jgi:hypothetical protein
MKWPEKIRNEKVGCSIHLSGTRKETPDSDESGVFSWAGVTKHSVQAHSAVHFDDFTGNEGCAG